MPGVLLPRACTKETVEGPTRLDLPSQPGVLTFFRQVLVDDQLAMPKVVEHRPKVRGVPVNQVGACFVL